MTITELDELLGRNAALARRLYREDTAGALNEALQDDKAQKDPDLASDGSGARTEPGAAAPEGGSAEPAASAADGGTGTGAAALLAALQEGERQLAAGPSGRAQEHGTMNMTNNGFSGRSDGGWNREWKENGLETPGRPAAELVGTDAEALSRIFERDARRYDGPIGLSV